MPKKNNESEKGDGLNFHNEVKVSSTTIAEIIERMPTSMGQLYRLFKKETFTDDEKATAARALGKSIEEIFSRNNSTPDEDHPIKDERGTENVTDNSRSIPHGINDQTMMDRIDRLLAIMERESITQMENAKTNNRLSALLEKEYEKKNERTEYAKT